MMIPLVHQFADRGREAHLR